MTKKDTYISMRNAGMTREEVREAMGMSDTLEQKYNSLYYRDVDARNRKAVEALTDDQRIDGTPMCFSETRDGQYRLRPLYYVTDADKAWYKDYYGIRYADAYEVYGLKRTGCCGCPISAKAVDDLEKIRPHEPNLVRAAWNVFGESYTYRMRYNEYKAKRRAEQKDNMAKWED